MKVALITTDNREHFKMYDRETPWLSSPIEVLLEPFQSAGIEVHILSCTRQPMRSPEKLAPNIYFHSLVVPKIGWMSTLYQGCIRAVRKKLKEIQPDIVHGQGSERECAIAAACSGFPNVVTLHGLMGEMARVLKVRPGSYYWLASLLEGFVLKRTGGVICISNYTREIVGTRARKTWVVPNALRAAFFTRPLSNDRPRECTILNVGVVSTYKRQNELLNVLEELHHEGLPFKAQFFGSASRNAYGTTFLDRVQNSPYLSYQGTKPLDELISAYDRASALVHVSAIETFGLVVAEALARNLKFIGFTSGGVADIVEKVEGAEGFADGDWAGLKAAITRWVRAGHPRPTTAAATMRKRYHPAEIARQHLEVYREVLSRR